MKLKKPSLLKQNEKGLISIIIVTSIIIIVALLVVAFASIVNRDRRQTLDHQLSIQARLAAESVVDEKIAEFREDPSSIQDVDTCGDAEPTFDDPGEGIDTTCFIVDTAPGPLQYDEVKLSTPTVAWINPGSADVDRIVITWQNIADSDSANQCHAGDPAVFPSGISSDDIGMLRFDFAKVNSSDDLEFNRESLRLNQLGGVLVPTATTDSGDYEVSYADVANPSDQPVIFGGCADSPPSAVAAQDPNRAFAVIDLPDNDDRYILRLKSLYNPSQVDIIGFDTNDEIVSFIDSQISIEATARVQDVVQRIQVRVPVDVPPAELVPDAAVHGVSGLCKMLETNPRGTTQSSIGC